MGLTAAKDGFTAELNTSKGEYDPMQYLAAIETLRRFVTDATVTLTVEELDLPSGRDLEELLAVVGPPGRGRQRLAGGAPPLRARPLR